LTKKEIQIAKENTILIAREILRRRRLAEAETSFSAFVKLAWPIIQPGTEFVPGIHIDAIAEHLEAVANGEIRQLIINVPPRHGKSSLIAVMFPAWLWITRPHEQFLFVSYAESLSLRDSRKCRSLIKSPWYQNAWNSRFSIVSDQNEKRRFDNDKMGYRLATSLDGSNTGEGGSFIIYDDIDNVKKITSPAIRETAHEFHDQTMSTRGNNPKTVARINIQQRCHEQDMTGHLTEKGGWELLVLPAEYEGSKKATSIGWSDPRTEPGQLLWPAQFGKPEIAALKVDLGEMGAAGQLQQRPSPGEGAMFKREWFNYWNPPTVDIDPTTREYRPIAVKNPGKPLLYKKPVALPIAFEQCLLSWDCAFKGESDSDYVAGHVWGRVGANFYLIDRERDRMDFPTTVKRFRKQAEEYPCPEKLIEDKANGPAVIATLKNEIPGIIAIEPDGGKIARANAIAPYVESGNVYLPNPEIYSWVDGYIEEHANFPRGKNDDDVDAGSQGVRRLADSMSNTGVPEFRVMPRIGEPETACHVEPDLKLQPHWRRWIAIAPGSTGAALWICETPTKSLRVYRELHLEGMDAHEVGRRIAEASIPDLQDFLRSIHFTQKWNIDVLMEKAAFAPVEPIGSYAELMEQGMLSYDPNIGQFEDRVSVQQELKAAKFSAQMAELEDASFDRLRDLLRFKPVDYEELTYDKVTAFKLAAQDINLYTQYMAACEGRVAGEWPKIKFSADCRNTVSALGAVKRNQEVEDPFIRALLIGISAPPSVMTQKSLKLSPGMKPDAGRITRRFARGGR